MTDPAAEVPLDALRYCRQVTRRRARNFYYGLKLMPEPKRSALYAVYAWMRRADDIVDASGIDDDERVARLRAFGADTDQAIAGQPPNGGPLWVGLSYAARRFPLSLEHFHGLLEGQLNDLQHRRYESFDELRDYCRRVASTVGLICIEIWGYHDPGARALAVDRGIAFQLTNMVRDYGQDFDDGRVYLPAEDFRSGGLDPAELRAWADPAACRAFMTRQIDRAESYYRHSAGLEPMISADCRPTLWAMTSIYHALLEKAREDPARIVRRRRLRLNSFTKAAIALRAKWMTGQAGPVRERER